MSGKPGLNRVYAEHEAAREWQNTDDSGNSTQRQDTGMERRESDTGRANRCFVCGPANDNGLHVRFRMDDDVCRAQFTPEPQHMGYDGVTHGGIVFSLLDDVMANWLWLQGQQCFTARAEIRYRQPLEIGTPVALEGRLLKRKGRLAVVEGKVLRVDSTELVAEATGRFMLRPA